MNIAIMIPALGGGGAERAAVLLGDYYYQKGHRVYFFLAKTHIKTRYTPNGEIVKTGIDLQFSENDTDVAVFMKLLKASFVIRKLKFKYKIHIAISYMEVFNYINILSYQGEKNIVSIRTVLSERTDLADPVYRAKFIKFFYPKSHCIVAVSKYAKKDLVNSYSIKPGRVCSIPNALEELEYDMEKNWQYGNETVIAVGRLDPVKQQEYIIRAFSYVAERNETANLLILGEGVRRRYLESLCVKYGLEKRVFFLGFRKNIGYFLAHSKLFVMSSKTEGFPNSMIEAMSFGLPVISTDSPGGITEIIGKQENISITDISFQKYGILVPYMTGKVREDDLEEKEIVFGKTMLKLLEDDRLYQKYRMRSFKRADDYSVDQVMKQWDHLIFGKHRIF